MCVWPLAQRTVGRGKSARGARGGDRAHHLLQRPEARAGACVAGRQNPIPATDGLLISGVDRQLSDKLLGCWRDANGDNRPPGITRRPVLSHDPELTVASSSSWTPSTSEILLGGVLDHLRDGGVATFRIGACAAQIRRIHGEILASNFHRGSSKLPISAMTFLAVVERGLSCSLAVGAKSSSARGGAVAAHILVP